MKLSKVSDIMGNNQAPLCDIDTLNPKDQGTAHNFIF